MLVVAGAVPLADLHLTIMVGQIVSWGAIILQAAIMRLLFVPDDSFELFGIGD